MARDALFDLAVARALSYALRTGPLPDTRGGVHAALEVWYLKTRFAYRVPLDGVIGALLAWPGGGATWRGGSEGDWIDSPTPEPPS